MLSIARHSATAVAAYIDLRRGLLDARVSELRGTAERQEIKGRLYWYDKYRIGAQVRRSFIGPDSPELRRRLERLAELRADAAARRDGRMRLTRLLRAEGMLSTDAKTGSLLAAMEKVGVFRLGGTLVGTQAFRLYEGELGIRLGLDQAAMTQDIDIASFERLSLALGDVVTERLADVFRELAFDPLPSSDHGRIWRWRQSSGEMLIEFLTPSFDAEEGLRDLPALGVSAQALHHLNHLIADPIPAVALYRSGVLVQIPRPERYAVHKLIVADRRRGGERLKAAKDRAQARTLIEVLAEDRPDDLAEAYAAARAKGPQWRKRIDATLTRAPEIADLIRKCT